MTEPAIPPLNIESAVHTISETAVAYRDVWDALDSAAADGDFGTTMHRGFSAVLDQWPNLDRHSDRAFLTSVSEVISREMGGSSGPMWAVGFLRAAQAFDKQGSTLEGLTEALEGAIDGIQEYGGAKLGDKTLLDALIPTAVALRQEVERGAPHPATTAARAAEAAAAGANGTTEVRARRGRAAYAGARSVGIVDPGAAAIASIVATIARHYNPNIPKPQFATGAVGSVRAASHVQQAVPTKQFVNDPYDAVTESLQGYALAHPELVVWDDENRVLQRPAPPTGLVGLVAGGGVRA